MNVPALQARIAAAHFGARRILHGKIGRAHV